MVFSTHSHILLSSSLALLSFGTLVGGMQRANAINITFDYSYDNGFFTGANSSRQSLLDEAASYFENNINDSLGAIVADVPRDENNPNADDPGEYDQWTTSFLNPSDGTVKTLDTATIAEGLTIFVGGRDLPEGTLGEGATGGFFFDSASNEDSFSSDSDLSAAIARSSEASFWGGSLTFDSSTNWHFGLDEVGLDNKEADFLSTAIHEIAHVLGFGTSSTWKGFIDTTSGEPKFVGPKSQEIYSNQVPLDSGLGHWNDSVTINGSETAMDPTITNGTRKLLTTLDYAGLEDIGWDVDSSVYAIPFEFSPSLGIFLIAGMFGTKKAWNAWKKGIGK